MSIRTFPTSDLNLVSFACVEQEEDCDNGGVHSFQVDEVYDEAAYERYIEGKTDESTCAICGHAIKYFCIVEHAPTGGFYAIGRDCFANVECLQQHNRKISLAHANFSKQVAAGRKAAREKKAGDVREERFAAHHPDVAEAIAWAAAFDLNQVIPSLRSKFSFGVNALADLRGIIRRYGSLSEKQLAFAMRIYAETRQSLKDAAALEEKTLAAIAAGLKAPEGRQRVSGKVLGTKLIESPFGNTTKVIVALDNGTKVWGTLPSCATGDKGAKVTFTASFSVSKDDPLFSFFARPTKWIEEKEQALAVATNQPQ